MKNKWPLAVATLACIMGMIVALFFWYYKPVKNLNFPSTKQVNPPVTDSQAENQNYPMHSNIVATTFWVGESASGSNAYIANSASAWDENWQTHYGGVDDPTNRNGFYPATFTPKENPFYFALPYNDFDSNGDRKADVASVIYWADQGSWDQSQSMLKNRWVKITKNENSVYAQWEDVGPFGEDDKTYVFGNGLPRSKKNNNAGIDLSPAVQDFLKLNGEEPVDWRFIDDKDVPDGPWKSIITTS